MTAFRSALAASVVALSMTSPPIAFVRAFPATVASPGRSSRMDVPAALTISPAAAATGAAALYLLYRLYRDRRDDRTRRAALSSDLAGGVGGNDDDDGDLSSLRLGVESAPGEGEDGPEGGCVYLDYNGTTPVHPLVLAAMIPFLSSHFGNPSSSHAYGLRPREAVARARRSVLSLLMPPEAGEGEAAKAEEEEDRRRRLAEEAIVFTGCGTESDNMAILLALESTRHMFGEGKGERRRKPHVVTSNVEHPAVAECLAALEARGEIEATYVPVDGEGIVPSSAVISAIRPRQTVLVTLMLANNESGSLQPVPAVSRACRERGVLFHTDAAQAAGKVPVRLMEDLGDADMVTLVGHKFGAPKGVAALYVRPGCLTESGRREPAGYGASGALLRGGGQERGRRAGTENVPYIAGMGRAAELLAEGDQWRENAVHMERMRSRLLDNLRRHLSGPLGEDAVRPNGPSDPSLRLPNTLSVGIRGVRSGDLLRAVSQRVAASAGSACHASGGGISAVLRAMDVPEEYAAGTLRLSVGPGTTAEEVDRAALIIAEEARRQLGGMKQ